MITMKLDLGIDPQKFIQQVQLHNLDIEKQVQDGLDAAIKKLSESGVLSRMIQDEAEKNILDGFTSFMYRYKLRDKIEAAIQERMGTKIKEFTDKLVDELAEKLNIDKSI